MTNVQRPAAGPWFWSGLVGLCCLLAAAVNVPAQVVEFLPGTPTVYEGGTNVAIVVIRAPATGDTTVEYFTRNGTALDGQDYAGTSGTLTFTNGENFKIISIDVLDNLLPEGTRSFDVVLTNATGGTLGDALVTVFIFDDDATFRLGSTAYVVSEGATNVVVEVIREGGLAGSASVEFFTANGAVSPAFVAIDYGGRFGTLLFSDGQETNTISIPIIGDCDVETNETLTLTITNTIGGDLSFPSVATITITDDDTAAGQIALQSVFPIARAPEGITFTVRAVRQCGMSGAVSATIAVANGFEFCLGSTNAAYGLDYRINGANAFGRVTVSWAAGEGGTKDIVIVSTNDLLAELDESIILQILLVTGGATVATDGNTLAVVLTSDDPPVGGVDPFFNPNFTNAPPPGANQPVYALATYNNPVSFFNYRKVLIAGDFTSFNSSVRNGLARLTQFGGLDTSFDVGDGPDGPVFALRLLPDERVVVAGAFSSFDNVSRNGIAVLDANGALDFTFDPGLGVDGRVTTVAVLGDGKILIGGDFSTFNNQPRRNLARLNADGTLDTTFDPGPGADDVVYALAVQPDGKVLVGGIFTSLAGVQAFSIGRLTDTGGVDPTFTPVIGADNAVYTMAVQADGRVLIAGAFSTYDTESRSGIARLNSDGTLDPTFNPGSGVQGAVFHLALQPNGQALIGGEFISYNGTPRTNLARLYLNGTLDTTFLDNYFNQTAPGPNAYVSAVALDAGTNVIIGGGFTMVGGGISRADGAYSVREVTEQRHVARLLGGDPVTPGLAPGNVEFVSVTYSVDENTPMASVTITLRRINGEVGSLRVDYSTFDGAARSNVHYSGSSGTVIWNDCDPGDKAIIVPVLDNALVDGNRSFFVRISNPVGTGLYFTNWPALGFQTSAEVTLIDNDVNSGVIGFSQIVYGVPENLGGTGDYLINVARTNGASGLATVRYSVVNGTATLPQDLTTNVVNTLTFASGETNKTIRVHLINDTFKEFEEYVSLRLFSVNGAALGQTNATLLIFDDEVNVGSLSFSAPVFTVDEGVGMAAVTVRRTSGSQSNVSVKVITTELPPAPGVAREGVDYNSVTSIVTFAENVTNQTVLVPIIADTLVEGGEILNVQLLDITGGARYGFLTNATMSIRDDDFYGSLSFTVANSFVSELEGTARVTVVRSGGSSEEVTVDYSASLGTATDGSDYAGIVGTLVFPDGVTEQGFDVAILNDPDLELSETIELRLFNFAKATPGTITNALLTINDDEALAVPAGSVDTFFNPAPGPNDNGFVNAVVVQPDGRLVVGGEFTAFNSALRPHLVRLNVDGSLDATFNPVQGANDSVQAVALQPDGKLIVGGRFTRFGGRNRNALVRLTSSGSVDTSFNPGAGADNPVMAVVLQENGRILIAGDFSAYNGAPRARVARVLTDGRLDATFDAGGGPNGTIFALAVQTDGRILIGGDFLAVGTNDSPYLARLESSGALDTSFGAGLALDGPVQHVALQSDGKVVITGAFSAVGGQSRNGIARLNTDGSLDGTFDPGAGANGIVYSVAIQDDGRFVLGGAFTSIAGFERNRIVRLNADGSIDGSINFGSGADGFVRTVVLQSDEQIVIGGGFTEVDGFPRKYLARLVGGEDTNPGVLEFAAPVYTVNENGTNVTVGVARLGGSAGQVTVDLLTLDDSATGGSDYVSVSTNLVFEDGQSFKTVVLTITDDTSVETTESFDLVLTNATDGAALSERSIARVDILNDDSVVTFQLASSSVNEQTLGGNASIIVLRSGATNNTVMVTAATLTNGTATDGLDYTGRVAVLTFAPGVSSVVFSVPIVDDLVVEGNETFGLVLSNVTAGAVLGISSASVTITDNDFSPGVITFSQITYSVVEGAGTASVTLLRTNGSTGVVGVQYALGGGTALAGTDYDPTGGTVSFAEGQTVRTISVPIVSDAVVEGNETFNITLSAPFGGTSISGPSIVSMTIEDDEFGPGSLDPSFDTGAGANSLVRVVAVESDGSVIAGGAFTNFNGFYRGGIVELMPAGAVNTNFDSGLGANAIVAALAPRADGKVAIAGAFTNVAGLPFNRVARLLTNGLTDPALDQPVSINAGVNALAGLADGSVILGGAFSVPKSGVLKLRANGGVDASFDPGAGANGAVQALAVQPDGRVLVAGAFSAFGGQPRQRVARLLSNGALDINFVPAAITNGTVHALALQGDGKILIGGEFTNVAGSVRHRIARLEANGALDATFDPGLGAGAAVYAIAVQTDGRIIIGGDFTSYNGTNRNRFARLNEDGGLDLVFDPGRGADNSVYAIALLPDGQVIIGGNFTMVNGFVRRGVARLNGDTAGSTRLTDVHWDGSAWVVSVQALAGQTYVLEATSDLTTWTPVSTNLAAGQTLQFSEVPTGHPQRFYRVRRQSP